MADKKIKYITEDDLECFIKTVIAECKLTHKAYSDMRILINGIFKYAKKRVYQSKYHTIYGRLGFITPGLLLKM